MFFKNKIFILCSFLVSINSFANMTAEPAEFSGNLKGAKINSSDYQVEEADLLSDSLAFAVNFAYSVVPLAWYYCPGKNELLYDVGLESVVDLVLGDFTRSLGDNPAAKNLNSRW